ncbi:MAG TPA: peptidoglycan editing factor PgeF [Terriglobales bacterium]|nr:peptidoglycan editing factor PgeF [Terriglobales bacterium]
MKSATKAGSKSSIKVLRAPALSRISWLKHGFSTRQGGRSKVYGSGALNLGFTEDDSRAAVERNRRLFIAALTGTSTSSKPSLASRTSRHRRPALATLRQIHSDIIHCISEVPPQPLAGDGLITNTPGILLGVLAADCFPLILVDPKQRAVGVFHAGWRGTVKRIVAKGIGEMHRWFGTKPSDLRAAIGPGNRGCCYEVGPELRSAFESQFRYANDLFRETKERNEIHERYPLLFLTARAPGHSELPKKIFLDLAEANRRQLIDAGVAANNIFDLGFCTSCRTDLFFSHRAEKGKTGRMMAVVGIEPEILGRGRPHHRIS